VATSRLFGLGNCGHSFKLWLSLAYTNAKYTNSDPDANGHGFIEAGDPRINAPEKQFNLHVSQNFEFRGMPLQINTGMHYTDEGSPLQVLCPDTTA
jgi:iron complex outermembrane receptor protein